MSQSNQIAFVDIINSDFKIKPKPIWIRVRPGKLWCPYCNRVKKFKMDKYLGVEKCESCGITIKDYYVKKFNRLGLFGVNSNYHNKRKI